LTVVEYWKASDRIPKRNSGILIISIILGPDISISFTCRRVIKLLYIWFA